VGPDLPLIGVAVDRGDGRQRLQLGQQLERPQVAGVENMVDPLERVEDLGAERP
jgi:hypothetical protein